MPDAAYTLADLCDLADVTPRTVRYYIAQGLLRSPGTSGPGARYDDGHLARLRLVRRLQREHLPLAEIRARLASLTDEEAIAQAEGPAAEPEGSALDYVLGVLSAPIARPPSAGLPPGVTRPPTDAPRPPRGAVHPPQPRLVDDVPESAVLRRLEMAAPSTMPGPASPPESAPAPARPPGSAPAPASPPGTGAGAPALPDRSHWERYVLAPDVELHVRRPLARSQNRAVSRLLETARQILEEDQP